MKKEGIYMTIRIYREDHEILEREFSKDNNFAEVIHHLVNKHIRKVE